MSDAPLLRRRHPSRKLCLEQGRKLSGAFNRARAIGFPLNTFVTIHWALAPSPVPAFDRWTRLCESLGKWLSRRGCPPTWAFVREKGLAEQEHIHIAAHVPKRGKAAFPAAVTRWVAAGASHVEPRAVDVKPQNTPSMYPLMKYMLKGGDGIVRRSWSIPKHFEADQGVIHGKRLGVSRNLDTKARHEAGLDLDHDRVAA